MRANPTRRASSSATASSCTTRCFGDGTPTHRAAADLVDHPTRGSGSCRCRTWPAATGSSRSTAGAPAGRAGRPAPRRTRTTSSPPTHVAVLDATGTDRAVLVGLSCGALWGIQLAADHPERVLGLVAIGPAVAAGARAPRATGVPVRASRSTHTEGWAKYNRALLGARLPRLPRVLLRADVPRAALDQADRGLRRTGGSRPTPATLVDTTRGLDGVLGRSASPTSAPAGRAARSW